MHHMDMDQPRPDADQTPTNIGDPVLGKSRLLSRQCDTCLFNPSNPLHLARDRRRDLIDGARATNSYVICHQTLPYTDPPPRVEPATCRGFYDRYSTAALQIMQRLWGFAQVSPPGPSSPAPPPQPDATADGGPATAMPQTDAATAYRPPPGRRPLVFIDVDGVLNPHVEYVAGGGAALETAGYTADRYEGPGPDSQFASGTVWLRSVHGRWLAELAALGAELVWATSWGHLANTWVAPRLGLPGDWPVVPVKSGGVRFGHARKLGPIAGFAAGRPFAVLDDEIGGKDPSWAAERTAGGAPTLLVTVDPAAGLRRGDVEQVAAWLRKLHTLAGEGSRP